MTGNVMPKIPVGRMTPPFSDGRSMLKSAADSSAQVAFSCSQIATAGVCTLTIQNANYTLAGLETAQTFTSVQTFGTACVANFGSGTTVNTRFGSGSGNDTATGDQNCVYGQGSLVALTTGTGNVGIGRACLTNATSASTCVVMGRNSGNGITTAAGMVALGDQVMAAGTITGSNCVAICNGALANLTSGSYNLAVGFNTGYNLTSASFCSFYGQSAGSSVTTGDYNTFLGRGTISPVVTTGTNNVGLGSAVSTTATDTSYAVMLGDYAIAASNELALGPNVNFQTWYGVSSTSATVARADLTVSWISSTHASRKARAILNVWDTAAREALRLDATGSAAQIGIGGAVDSARLLKINGDTASTGWIQQQAARSRVTADATKTDTTFANLTDLSLTLTAGRMYTGRLVIKCVNSTATEGIKFDCNGGSATMTNFWAGAGILASGGTDVVGTNISTSLAGVINFTTFTGESVVVIELSMVVNAGGTFIPRFAENSTAIGTATVRLGSYLWLEDSFN